MRLKMTTSKNAVSYYAIKSFYSNGRNTSKIVHKFGTHAELLKQLDGRDPKTWVLDQIEQMNAAEKEESDCFHFSVQEKEAPLQTPLGFNCGYLYLQKIFHELRLHKTCQSIQEQSNVQFCLSDILSRLVYGRILFPASKLSTFELAKQFLEPISFQLHDVYRALDLLAEHSDLLQKELYTNSLHLVKRNTRILYYDCTNFFFEIDQPDEDKQHGISKQHQPSPIVQMGLFMDADGLPLAFHIFPGNQNEQQSMLPLEKIIVRDFRHAKFVVCTDAGLSSYENRQYNDFASRAFVTTQSIKTLKGFLKDWALDRDGWKKQGASAADADTRYCLDDIDEHSDNETLFYKERWINERGLQQRLIVTFSLKRQAYQRAVRDGQIDRAVVSMNKGGAPLKKRNPNDYRRFAQQIAVTKDGEIADQTSFTLNQFQIAKEQMYDGFYGTCTNLDGSIQAILQIVQRRWQIEDCFRVLKTDLRARPVYLQRKQRIRAHFITCFIALLVLRILEKRVQDNKHSCTTSDILRTLRSLNWTYLNGEGYHLHGTRTELTDCLRDTFGFSTTRIFTSLESTRKILRQSKQEKVRSQRLYQNP